MSAMGSVIVTARSLPSPRALRHAGDLARMGHLPEADPAEPEVAVYRARATAPAAARVRPHLELRLALLLVDQCLLGHLCVTPARHGGTGSRAHATAHALRHRSLRSSRSSRSCRERCRSCRNRSPGTQVAR